MQTLKQAIKVIISLALAFVVLFSIGGFSIYSHHCNHSNTANYSLYIPADECNHENSTDEQCCKSEPISCCSTKKAELPLDDCCSNEAKYAKLDVETLLNHVSPSLKEQSFALLFISYNAFPFEFNLKERIVKRNLYFDTPISISTSEYLSQIQVFII